MFKVLVLICAANLGPADCQAETALAVIDGPAAQNEIECGLHGQAYVADTALVRPGSYVKVMCRRDRVVAARPLGISMAGAIR